jgi:4-hydroxybenzoate polyprenyltransferase
VTAAATLAEPVARHGRVKGFLRLVMIEHSVFALPFAYIAALTASKSLGDGVHWLDLLWITVAMVSARTLAMAANRVIDRELDARNPRTAQRELVTGALSLRTAYAGMAVALVIFLLAAGLLGPLPLALAPLAVVALVGYPYGKRFTWACHFILGLAQMVAPIGAWIGVTGAWSWDAVLLGAAMGLWIAGFDIIYACQDYDHDRAEGVHSLPGRFGIATALWVSSAVHVTALGFFGWFGVAAGFGATWWMGVALAGAALIYEHTIVRPDDLSRVNRAFFTVNGLIGIGLFAFAVVDLVGRGLHA